MSHPFEASHPVVGMCHLLALPGAPDYDGDRTAIRERAVADARRLESGGVDAILLENYGDAPFVPDSVPPHVVAEMTAIASQIGDAVDCPLGINVLRNDAEAALSIAAAVDAAFVRVNVHAGAAVTDQGILEGRAHETLRLRERIDADVALLADVHVKHATPLADRPIDAVAVETLERGRADGVIVTGGGTGHATAIESVEDVATALGAAGLEQPVFVGSGVTPATVGEYLAAGADGCIVGTALKRDGVTHHPVEESRVQSLTEAVQAVA